MDIEEELEQTRKRKRQITEDEVLARRLQEEENNAFELPNVNRASPFDSGASVHVQGDGALRHKHAATETISPVTANQSSTFRLLSVGQLPAWANSGCVSIRNVIQGDVQVAIISNYMVDVQWLLSACPLLRDVPKVVIFHGESGGSLERLKAHKPPNWILYKPPLRISYGTHHSKAMFLIYKTGVRIIIHTANLIHVDWNNKSQGLWTQDFPRKKDAKGKTSTFENDLVEYLTALEWSGCKTTVPTEGEVQVNAAYFRRFDYSDASVRLVASVPGYHNGRNLPKWGHMKLRSILAAEQFKEEFVGAPVVFQFSSLGSLDEKWLSEFSSSVSAGSSKESHPLGQGKVQIVWPTVEDVRSSIEGYSAGNALPSPMKNVQKSFLQKYWSRWQAEHSGRSRAMPHIKTFVRYRGQSIAFRTNLHWLESGAWWLLLTSSNLSKAAWGALQKNASQLMIRSYELGVCFLPSLAHSRGAKSFSCTVSNGLGLGSELQHEAVTNMDGKGDCVSNQSDVRFVTTEWEGEDTVDHIIRLPLPYRVPPDSYDSKDVPWSWNRQCEEPDVYGQGWPRSVQVCT